MILTAEKIIKIEQNENEVERLCTMFVVQPGETVEALMERLKVTGKCDWHFEVEVRVKLVKPC